MEDKILSQIKGTESSKVKELILDSCKSTSVEGLTDEFNNLENLSMMNVGLTNLKGLPRLPKLQKLELSDNKISGDLQYVADACPKLKYLHLNGNPIKKIEDLAPLAHLSNLKYLELQTCPVSSVKNYRKEVFTLLPNIHFLDGLNQNDEDANDSDAENHRNVNCSSEKRVKKEAADSAADSNEEEEEEDEDDGSEEEYSDSEEEESIGLDYLQKNQIDEESEDNDYSPSGEDESDVDIESDEEYPRGEKRKLEEDDDE